VNSVTKIDFNRTASKNNFTQNSISMNTTQIIPTNKNEKKIFTIIDKNEIFNEFMNMQKNKQNSITNYNNLNNQVVQKIDQDNNKIKFVINKFPYENKFVNNRSVIRASGNSEPKKIISSSIKRFKAGGTYTGHLYNNKMESKLFYFF